MPPLANVEALARVYAERGAEHYGEGVTQLEHALQSAVLAEAARAPASLIVAALLHDIGHLLIPDDAQRRSSLDAHHERMGEAALRPLFGETVRAPIRLHVAAKRYLCFAEPAYFNLLSQASIASLALQGGPMTVEEAAQFERQTHWRDAVELRKFDDLAKRDETCGRRFEDFMPLLRASSVYGSNSS
jgi:phosphonate degradation associated HDIG domain protein